MYIFRIKTVCQKIGNLKICFGDFSFSNVNLCKNCSGNTDCNLIYCKWFNTRINTFLLLGFYSITKMCWLMSVLKEASAIVNDKLMTTAALINVIKKNKKQKCGPLRALRHLKLQQVLNNTI